MEQIVFDENYAKIYLNEEDKYLKIVWAGFVKSEDFRKGSNYALKLVLDKDLEGWYADLLDMKIIRQEDKDWANEIWFPKIIKSKLVKMAILNSKHIANKLSIENIFIKASDIIPFDTMYFDDESKAFEWMLSR